VREALFSRLDHAGLVAGAHVLDLYAGSGALGLEAASRGAADVVLVESARAAADVCRRNAAALGLDVVRVVPLRVSAFLRQTQGRVDLVFLDPPYDVPEAELTEALVGVARVLAPGGVVVVERSVRTPEPTWPSGVVRADERRYGDTVLWFAEASPPAPEPGSAGPEPA
jgi:16S rRNA (guanine966-N2)-methyltransferase